MSHKSYLNKTNHSPSSSSSESVFKLLLQFSSVLVALVTALLYLFGRIYYETYLSYWGLSESLFPLSKEQAVISGFLRFIVYGVSVLSWLSIATLVCLAIVAAVFISCYRPVAEFLEEVTFRLKRSTVPSIKSNVVVKHTHDKVINAVTLIISGINVVFILILVFAYSCSRISDRAKDNANKERDKILAGDINNEPFTSHALLSVRSESNGFVQYSGYLIKTSATHAALYRKDVGVSILPLASVSRIVIRENRAAIK